MYEAPYYQVSYRSNWPKQLTKAIAKAIATANQLKA